MSERVCVCVCVCMRVCVCAFVRAFVRAWSVFSNAPNLTNKSALNISAYEIRTILQTRATEITLQSYRQTNHKMICE